MIYSCRIKAILFVKIIISSIVLGMLKFSLSVSWLFVSLWCYLSNSITAAVDMEAENNNVSQLSVRITYPVDGTDIEHAPMIAVQYEIFNFDTIGSAQTPGPADMYLLCMSFETMNNGGCMPLTTMWPTSSAYQPVIRDTIVGERVIFMHIIDPYNNTISEANATFFVTHPGKTRAESVDIFSITSNDDSNNDPQHTAVRVGSRSVVNRKNMFDYVFENQAWGRRLDNFHDYGSAEDRGRKGLAFLEYIEVKGQEKKQRKKPQQREGETESAMNGMVETMTSSEADDYSRSGPGSTLAASYLIRHSLVDILNNYGITSMIDVPCGDLHWLTHVDLGATKLSRYVGADISTSLLTYNKEKINFMNQLLHLRASLSEDDFDRRMTLEVGLNLFGLFHDALATSQYAQFVQTVHQVDMYAIDLVSMSGQDIYKIVGDTDLLFNRHMMYHLSPTDNLMVLKHVQEYGQIVLTQRRMRCTDNICDLRPFYFMSSTAVLTLNSNLKDYVLLLGNVEINLMRSPYCLKHPLGLYRDGPKPNRVDYSSDRSSARHVNGEGDTTTSSTSMPPLAGSPDDMYMGLWAMYSPQDTLYSVSSNASDRICS